MSFVKDLHRLKQASVKDDHLKTGKALFAELEVMGQKIAQRAIAKLDEPRIKEGEIIQDERVSAREAMKRINLEASIRRMFDKYTKQIMPLRENYYRETMFKIARAWTKGLESDVGEYTDVNVKFTKREIHTITKFVESTEISEHLNHMRSKTIFRVNALIKEAYKEIPKIKREYRAEYKDRLQGALRGINASFRGLTNGWWTEIFEQAEGRFLGAINGI